MEKIETRKLPKKTIFIMVFIILIALLMFLQLKSLKEQKIEEILVTIGHKNIKELVVINRLEVEDKITKMTSNVFKVKFYDNDLNKTCVGFIHKERDNSYTKDFDCK